jgi:uncharacterized protein (DUF433 family)
MSLHEIITIDPEIMNGTPVFKGSRVPIVTLFDYLQAGDPLERFLDHFPSVEPTLARNLLEEAEHSIFAAFELENTALQMAEEV